MMLRQFNPIEYFVDNPLAESLLLSFQVDERNGEVEIVYDYAAEVVSRHFENVRRGDSPAAPPTRDFRRLVLVDVGSISIVGGSRGSIDASYWESLNQEISRSQIVVEDVSLRAMGGRYILSVAISRGRAYCIEFGSMLVGRRLGNAVPTSRVGVWKYVDSETGTEFPFRRPFSVGE